VSEPIEDTSGIRTKTRLVAVAALAAVLVAAAIVAAVRDDSASASSSDASALPVVEVPAAGADSASWFCAAGSSAKDGRADETLVLANVGSSPAAVNISVYSGTAGASPATRQLELDARSQTRVRVADIAAVAEPAVTVEARGGQVVVEHELEAFDDVATGPCARRGSSSWYFANGTTGKGFEQQLVLYNPYPDEAVADLVFITEEGVKRPEDLTGRSVPKRSRITIPVHEVVRRNDVVGVIVQTRTGRRVAERVITANGSDGPRGIAVSLGQPELATSFVVAEAVRSDANPDRLIVMNPSDSDSTIEATVQPRNELSFSPLVTVVPARSVTPLELPQGLAPDTVFSLSARVTSGPPVAFEQWSVAPAKPRSLASVVTAVVAARSWVIAGARSGERDFAVVENAGTRPVRVTVSEIGDRKGPAQRDAFEVAPGRSVKVALSDLNIADTSAVVIGADGPVSVFRFGRDGATRSPAIPFPG